MYCNDCGKVIQDDANVCAYCGKPAGAVAPRRKLLRPKQGRKIAGVCAGFAEYFDVDVTLVRLLWLVAAIVTCPLGLVAYIVAWIIMPEQPEAAAVVPVGTPATMQQG
jgi:phage shock protein C